MPCFVAGGSGCWESSKLSMNGHGSQKSTDGRAKACLFVYECELLTHQDKLLEPGGLLPGPTF